ncbi:hypothetical protein DXX93_06145 [Thalassotalea euphylliae]|uniref:Fibrobacter succinogenes major paralogous domain-containing protein n=1 Tax=Thalassotalea euphylliae TaxID=1655234 RepID=A0A3E0TQH3_9GAMM|nr:fibrobacter succinogenes major paralogous domain-containing protein [Thalassotalea euphylliae]REL26205.1 hypothetical protein DXX93_06145 [Thalassotalea euphylliae]
MKPLILALGAIVSLTTVTPVNALDSISYSQTYTNSEAQADSKAQPSVQDSEGNSYRTVKIGDQIWLAENLRSTKFQDGSAINTAFIPDDDENKLLTYGRLYNWHDVVDERNICPEGWRVATDADWQTLEKTIGMADADLNKEGWRGDNDLAITLKEAQPDSWFKKFDQSKVNQSRFSARPAGVKWGRFYLTQGIYTEFWTSTGATDKKAYNRTLVYPWWNPHKGEINRVKISKDYMFSVRCIKI